MSHFASTGQRLKYHRACTAIFLAAVTLTHVVVAEDSVPAECNVLAAGAPACSNTTTPGSTGGSSNNTRHVGNPIEVLTGNKYQQDTDFHSFISALSFVRHFNSSLTNHDLSLGPGWRHTYHVVLSRTNAIRLNIVQSDGRRIGFNLIRGTALPEVYRADDPADGVLTLNDTANWYLSDGRRLQFHGSFLVEIDYNDHRGALHVRYRKQRIATVNDAYNNTLKFEYVSRDNALPGYGSEATAMPVGALASVELPNGQLVLFNYDNKRNLTGVAYADGASMAYGYNNIGWPSHLTSRSAINDSATADNNTDGNRQNNWSYADDGRAIGWSQPSSDNNGLSIQYETSTTGESSATVNYADGQSRRYTWQRDALQTPTPALTPSDSLISSLQCHGCPIAELSGAIQRVAQQHQPALQSTSAKNDSRLQHERTSEESLQNFWANLGQSAQFRELQGRLNRDGYPLEISLDIDRLGNIIDLQLGQLHLSELSYQALNAGLPQCSAEQRVLHANQSSARLAQLGSGAQACIDDLLLLLELAGELGDYAIGNSPHYTNRAGRNDPPPRRPPPDPFCTLPTNANCADLTEAHEMALLSACVYPGGVCPARWQPVPPGEVGLTDEHFDDDGFHAELFYDPLRDRYTLAFRGTNNDGDDWESNQLQGRGEEARQYRLAFELANTVQLGLQGGELNFTGHSLGGGLATVAALSIAHDAIVFNTAALHPDSATLHGIDIVYPYAELFITHYSTESDPLTGIQGFADALNVYGTQAAPGIHTEIPNPYDEWVNARQDQLDFWEGRNTVIYHSMAAVVESLDTLLARHCTTVP